MNHRPLYSVHTIAELDGPVLPDRRRHVRSRDRPRRRDQRAPAVGQHPAYGDEPLAERQRLGVRAVVPKDDCGGIHGSGQERERQEYRPYLESHKFHQFHSLGATSPLTSGNDSNILPVWSRDGRRILFASNRGGDWDTGLQLSDEDHPPDDRDYRA